MCGYCVAQVMSIKSELSKVALLHLYSGVIVITDKFHRKFGVYATICHGFPTLLSCPIFPCV